MKNEFNFLSVVKALAHDISPKRIHAGLKAAEIVRRGKFYDPDSRLDSVIANVPPMLEQAIGMLFGFQTGIIGAYLGSILMTGRNGSSSELVTAAALMGGVAGAALLNPVFAKGITKWSEVSDHAFTKLFNKISRKLGEREDELRQFPQFEAFPEFSKALYAPKPQ